METQNNSGRKRNLKNPTKIRPEDPKKKYISKKGYVHFDINIFVFTKKYQVSRVVIILKQQKQQLKYASWTPSLKLETKTYSKTYI